MIESSDHHAATMCTSENVMSASLTAIIAMIAESIKAISDISDNISKAKKNGIEFFNVTKIRRIQTTLRKISGTMATVNGSKIANLLDLQKYIESKDNRTNWMAFQSMFGRISRSIKDLMTDINNINGEIVRSSSIEIASNLNATLRQQVSVYDKLSNMKEPRTKKEIEELSLIADNLQDLITNIVILEENIESYLKKIES